MTDQPSQSTRRDFLQGKSAAKALGDLGHSTESSEPAAYDSTRNASRSYLVHVSRRAMACEFEVMLNAGQDAHATEQAIAALDLIEQLEDQLSVYRHRSEVSQLNAVGRHRPVRVEARLFELLQLARQLYDDTQGAFDITTGPLIQLWRKARREGQLPTRQAVEDALACVGFDKLGLISDQPSVQFLEAGVTIDLGGIGKGYALDRCAEQFSSADVQDYLIHGGSSSILARGHRQSGTERNGWTVGVQHPLRPDRRLLELQLCDGAVGTSGAGTHQFFVQGRRYGHILDPRTGYPSEGILSTTVVAPQAAVADALSTAFYVMGLEAVDQYCQQHPQITALISTPARQGADVELHSFNAESLDWQRYE